MPAPPECAARHLVDRRGTSRGAARPPHADEPEDTVWTATVRRRATRLGSSAAHQGPTPQTGRPGYLRLLSVRSVCGNQEGLDVVVGRGQVVEVVEYVVQPARSSTACRRKEGTTSRVTAVTTPTAPSPSQAASNSSGSCARLRVTAGAVRQHEGSRPAFCADEDAIASLCRARSGCHCPGSCLRRDVHVGQRRAVTVQSDIDVVQHGAGRHGGRAATDAEQSRQAFGSQQDSVGGDQRGERVAGARGAGKASPSAAACQTAADTSSTDRGVRNRAGDVGTVRSQLRQVPPVNGAPAQRGGLQPRGRPGWRRDPRRRGRRDTALTVNAWRAL